MSGASLCESHANACKTASKNWAEMLQALLASLPPLLLTSTLQRTCTSCEACACSWSGKGYCPYTLCMLHAQVGLTWGGKQMHLLRLSSRLRVTLHPGISFPPGADWKAHRLTAWQLWRKLPHACSMSILTQVFFCTFVLQAIERLQQFLWKNSKLLDIICWHAIHCLQQAHVMMLNDARRQCRIHSHEYCSLYSACQVSRGGSINTCAVPHIT
jgi:hypothetical protein